MAMFEVVLRNTKSKQYYSMMLFIVLLNIAVFIITFFYSGDRFIRMAAVTGAVLSLIALLVDLAVRRKGVDNTRLRNSAMVISACTWIFIGNYWAFALCVLLLFLFSAARRRLAVQIGQKFVLYPSFPQRRIEWSELNNIILKDGLLTIDFKNDKLLQSEIIESSAGLNEQEFNEFCRQQLR
jgi:uncharacterized membrane protein